MKYTEAEIYQQPGFSVHDENDPMTKMKDNISETLDVAGWKVPGECVHLLLICIII